MRAIAQEISNERCGFHRSTVGEIAVAALIKAVRTGIIEYVGPVTAGLSESEVIDVFRLAAFEPE
jgi:hypothetical protein